MIVVLVLLIFCGVGYLLYLSSQPDGLHSTDPPPTEEELLQARLDLHHIERRIDRALSKQETHQAAARTKQAIAEALENER